MENISPDTSAENLRRPTHIRLTFWDPLAALALGLILTVFAQYRIGAFSIEYSVDAASHYISGAMIHDYLRTRPWTSPLAYLIHYHSQYPLVGIGLWPPAFYAAEAVWMALAGSSKTSMLLLSALVTSTCATVLYWLVARNMGRLMGAFMAGALLLSPLVQQESAGLMLDIPLMLACLVAAAIYARYLSSPTVIWGFMFGLAASAAILTKGNAFSLAMLPPFALALGRRLDLMKRASFWTPALVVAVLAGFWTAATYGKTSEGFRYAWGLGYTSLALQANASILWDAIGPLLPFSLIGLAAVAVRLPIAQDHTYSSAAALMLAVFVFQCIVPVAIQARYMLPAVPAALILAPLGIHLCVRFIRRVIGRAINPDAITNAVTLSALCVLVISGALFQPSQHAPMGLAPAIDAFWASRQASNPVILAALGGDAEGPAIAEIAARDPARPSAYVIRASRLLGGGGYNNHEYEPKFKTPEQVMEAIDTYAVPYVLLRRSSVPSNDWEHLAQIEQAVVQFPERWHAVYRDATRGIVLYRVVGNEAKLMDVAQLRALSAPKALSR